MVLEPSVLFAWLIGVGGFLLVLVSVCSFLLWECSSAVWGLAAVGRLVSASVWGFFASAGGGFLLFPCLGFSG